MTLLDSLQITQVLLACAFIQQSAEHLAVSSKDRPLFILRILLCLLLLSGLWPTAVLTGLATISLVMLHRFQGPYNGGSDRMSLLILWCLLGAHLLPNPTWREAAFGYLAMQVTLSYFLSGIVKLRNHDWRSGQALSDVFAFSAYPVSEALRQLSLWPRLMWAASWAVILFEVAFPLALFHPVLLMAALIMGAGFHLANACLFGLNRFFWIWLAAYPSLLWLHNRIPTAF